MDSNGKYCSSRSWHSDATTCAVPSSDFILAVAKCSAQPATRHSSCIPHPSASTSPLSFFIRPNSQTPAPSETPQPTVQPEVKTTTPPPVHTDEMLQKLRTNFKEGMENILQKFHDSHHPPTLPTPPTPINPSLPLQAPSSVPRAPNLPRSPGPDRRSRSKARGRAHYREEKRPVATYRSPPR